MPTVDKVCAKGGKALVRGGALISCCCCNDCLPACCKTDGTCEPMAVGDCLEIGGAPGVRYGLGGDVVFAYACCSQSEACQEELNPDGVILSNNGVSCEAICADDACCPEPPLACDNRDVAAGTPQHQPHVCCICDGWPIMPDVIDVIFPAITAVPCSGPWVGQPCSQPAALQCCNDICDLTRQAAASLISGGISLTRVFDGSHATHGNPCVYSGSACTTTASYSCPDYPNEPGFPFPLSCSGWQVCVTVTLTFGFGPLQNQISIGISTSAGTCGVCNCPGNITPPSITHTMGFPRNCAVFEYAWSPGSSFTKDDPDSIVQIML